MAWQGTQAQKRAYAQKKRLERTMVGGAKPLPGYKVPPDKHPCDSSDIIKQPHPGTSLIGWRCTVCGRQWRYTPGFQGWPTVEVVPLTRQMPSPTTNHADRATKFRGEPTGALNELPLESIVGSARGEWWMKYQVLAQERQKAARRAFEEGRLAS